ncbi:membrane lipoprotein [Francisella philomiragia]|nr:membrane lipoprotein [Francisella philomiragia]
MLLNEDLKLELYRMMIWGGVWALILVSPFPKNIWIRSAVMALIVILFNYMIRMPYSGDGFFASNAGDDVFYANLIFNCSWALLAGLIYSFASNK